MNFSEFKARQTEMAAEADSINVNPSKAAIIELVARRHAQYPQYAGHWDGPQWRLVQAVKTVSTKGGVVIRKGDYTIARATTLRENLDYLMHTFDDPQRPARTFVFVQSLLTQCETAVEANSVRFLPLGL